MLKRLFSFKKQKKDAHFISYNNLRAISNRKAVASKEKTKSWMKAEDALKVNIIHTNKNSGLRTHISKLSARPLSSPVDDEVYDKPIVVSELDQNPPFYNTNPFPLTIINSESKLLVKGGLPKSLGIFSDVKIHSEMIKSELKQHDISVKYFIHPKTFTADNYSVFDDISAWIIYLSDEVDEVFLDKIIDRYIDKPTLFLCAKTNRIKTTQKINQFVLDNHLTVNQLDYNKYL